MCCCFVLFLVFVDFVVLAFGVLLVCWGDNTRRLKGERLGSAQMQCESSVCVSSLRWGNGYRQIFNKSPQPKRSLPKRKNPNGREDVRRVR